MRPHNGVKALLLAALRCVFLPMMHEAQAQSAGFCGAPRVMCATNADCVGMGTTSSCSTAAAPEMSDYLAVASGTVIYPRRRSSASS